MDASPSRHAGAARTAGIVCLVGGLLGAVLDVSTLVTGPGEVSVARNLGYALLQLTVVVGLVGTAVLGATGSAWWGRVGLGVAILSYVALICAELVEPFDPAAAAVVFELVPLVFGPGMLLAGAAVLRARRWSGWRRHVPLAVGVYVFVVFLPVVVALGETGFWAAVVGLDLLFAALGLAVVRETATAGARARSRVA